MKIATMIHYDNKLMQFAMNMDTDYILIFGFLWDHCGVWDHSHIRFSLGSFSYSE